MINGYTIPVKVFCGNPIDVDKERGIYLGHVTTATNSKGEIYAVYPKWHGPGQIVMKKSIDGGKTWSERLPVPDSWSKSYNTPHIYRMEDVNGKERLMLFGSHHFPPFCSVSEDSGNTWSEFDTKGMPNTGCYGFMGMTEIDKGHYLAFFQESGTGRRCTYDTAAEQTLIFAAGSGADRRTMVFRLKRDMEGNWVDSDLFGWVSKDGSYLREGEKWTFVDESFRAGEYEDHRHEIYQVESADGGLTWSEPRMIAATTADCYICEPEVIKSPDGKELTMILRENNIKYNSMIMQSRDNGKTWTEPRELPHGALTGHRHCARFLKDGRLLVTFRDWNPYSPTDGHFAGWIGTYDDLVSGREGEARLLFGKVVSKYDCGYSGIEILQDGSAAVTTYGRWSENEMPYIRCFRFHPNEVGQWPDL